MSRPDICWLGTATLTSNNGLPRVRCFVPITGPNDVEEFGEIFSFQALGLTALPAPPDDKGHAEGVLLRDCGGRDGVLVGGRDSRCAKVYANMQAGDTVLHSVDPEAKAQVRCHANKQIAIVTEDKDGNTMAQLFDAQANKIQIVGFGGVIEMSKDNGILMSTPDGKTAAHLNNGQIAMVGDSAFLPVLVQQGAAYLGAGSAGMNDPNLQFVALANLVLAELQKIQTWAASHTHVAPPAGGATAVAVPVLAAPSPVAAIKVKAE